MDDLAFATGSFRIDLAVLAARLGADPEKYYRGLGQSEMSVVAEDEDIVTMGAAAAQQILDRSGGAGVRTLMFATETGIDQSKAAGVYAHRLLGLGPNVRVVELKQACYSATAAMQFAVALVARDPSEKVLVIASDIARYQLDSAAEPTQGAGAVAFTVAANPALLELHPANGVYTDDVMDFWRPNHSTTAIVDGKSSITAYLDAVAGAFDDYLAHGGVPFEQIDRFCYHQPFTKMAVKAHRHLAARAGSELDPAALQAQIEPTMGYNRRIGNSYTASVYLALLALLDGDEDLTGKRVAIASYGSGAVAEFLTGTVADGYRAGLRRAENEERLTGRTPVDDAAYLALQRTAARPDPSNFETARQTPSPFRFGGVRQDQRVYEPTA
ncbi:hydroxymethylglutaryl-CoA synthase [Occultella glacieicola]|uniref:hydroxymethylglutaryl-CoA synthase n=1 Tax=Occultella glacieicola TaxID=2518684 RepID=UPI0022A81FF8|nr:hydroxymethylglutaryl-CoA synthase [Occultella glacieicola]